MKLRRIAKGRWDVLAPVDEQGRCPVLDLLDPTSPGRNAARGFLSVCLQVYLPLEGPPTSNRRLCSSLGDGLFELRWPGKAEPRILFFDDDKDRIVCTNAFSDAEVAAGELLQARGYRERYFEDGSEIQVIETAEGGLTWC
jgi:hypothetical protein